MKFPFILCYFKDSPLIPLLEHQNGFYKYEVSITTGGWKGCGTTANVSMTLHGTENTTDVIKLTCDIPYDRKLFAEGNTDNFLLRHNIPLGEIFCVQIGHDISGEDPSWFISEILAVDCQTGQQWLFSCHRWLALERDDGDTLRRFYANDFREDDEFKRTFSALRRNGFADDHLWFSVIKKQARNHFTRVQRASCCWSLLMLSMVTSAMFYEKEDPLEKKIQIGPFLLTRSQLIIALESALTVLPASLLIVFLFRKSEPKRNTQGRRYHLEKSKKKPFCSLPYFCVYIGWFLCIGTAITSALFTVFYSLMWGGEKSKRWLATVVLSLTGDVIISQPIKILIVSIIVASRSGCSRRMTKDTKSTNGHDGKELTSVVNLSSWDVERAKKFKRNERRMYAYLKELVFSMTFFALLLIVCYGEKSDHRYKLNAATERSFQFFDNMGRYKVRTLRL